MDKDILNQSMNLNKLKQHDWLMSIAVILLLGIGLITIYAATVKSTTLAGGEGTVIKQLIFVITGLVIYFIISLLDFSWFRIPTILTLMYIGIFVALVYVKIFGESIAGTNRWIDFGFFSFQPSEYAKIIIILTTSAIFTLDQSVLTKNINFSKKNRAILSSKLSYLLKYWNEFRENFPYWSKLLISILISAPLILLTFIQPALGSTVIIFCIWYTLIYFSFPNQKDFLIANFWAILSLLAIISCLNITRDGADMHVTLRLTLSSLIHLLMIIVASAFILRNKLFKPLLLVIIPIATFVGIMGFIFTWNNYLPGYQKDRIDIFVQSPESNPTGSGYQVRQSKIAIGSGRLAGRGFLGGTQSSLQVLTQSHTDFVFATISEQFGFIGGVSVLFLYIVILLRVIFIGLNARNDYGSMVCAGVSILILLHIFINVGMNLGKLPVTGIPLPLISYGGSSVFLILLSLGIVQSIGGSRRSVDIADDLMLRSRSLMH